MEILKVPPKFLPNYKSIYPPYSCGKNLEEIFFEFFIKYKDVIKTERIYIPIFWTSFYILRNYGKNISDLCSYLDINLDKKKKYSTICQYASGIYWNNKKNIDIIVFSSGGGGINKSKEISVKKIYLEKYKKYRVFL